MTTARSHLTEDKPISTAETELRLQILQTTDIHANLCAYDYHADRPVRSYGLTRVATLIRQAREDCVNTLLFDNGDFLQGTPLSDLTAAPNSGWQAIHPVMQAMNALKYDAAGLGNHEFNFGLDWLQEVLAQADFPVTCANALTSLGDGPEGDISLLPPHIMLKRRLIDASGQPHDLRIGVFGLVPPQITTWDKFHLAGKLWSRGIEETARHIVPHLRQAGADLVICLAHTGIDTDPRTPLMENAALVLAQLGGIDAMLAGHTHHVFPSSQLDGIDGINADEGTFHGVPTVMSGFRGSHLGVIDLNLGKSETGRWHVMSSKASVRPVQFDGPGSATTAEDEQLFQALRPAHNATIARVRQPLGRTETPLHSYLAMIGASASVQVVTEAQSAAVRHWLSDQIDPDLPLLSASAAFKTGGRGGARHFSDVSAGPVFLRHAADLYPFPNVLCLLRQTGAQVKDWLERAATIFNTIIPGETDQPLLRSDVPGHTFDIMDGVQYQIDLSQPALYDKNGVATDAGGSGRIAHLTRNGTPVAQDDEFLIASNNYRCFGGGPYRSVCKDEVVHASKRQIVDLIAAHIRVSDPLPGNATPVWQFVPLPGTSVNFDTGPGLRRYPQDIAAHHLTDLGDTDKGFARFSMTL